MESGLNKSILLYTVVQPLDSESMYIRGRDSASEEAIIIVHCLFTYQASLASRLYHSQSPHQNAFLFLDTTCCLSTHDIHHRHSDLGSSQERWRRRRWRRRWYCHHKRRTCIGKGHDIQSIHLCRTKYCKLSMTHLTPETRILIISKPPPTDGSAGTTVSFSVTEAQCTIPTTGLQFGGALTASLTASPKTGTVGCKFTGHLPSAGIC